MEARALARSIGDFFGGDDVRVVEHLSADETFKVHVLSSRDSPQAGLTSYCTIDMGEFDNQLTEESGRPLRIELLAVCQSGFEAMGDVLGTCAFNVATGEYSITPNTIFPGAIEVNDQQVRMKHVLLTSPWLWDSPPETIREDDRVTAWLQVVPIDDAELSFAQAQGIEALLGRFEEGQVDVFDLNRPTVDQLS